ncbi:replication initiator protein A [Fusobacterium varium]|uniref:replication initiator protein A n=1 Tax=Fusobacterium varium TaxID=856 RepID=UPI000E416436|nr:replication initiator protein A [Fusobacterium varium]RGJ31227.1 hypothetical protein DXD66_02565 [Fusobacterium varium]
MEYITISDIDGKGFYQLNKSLFNNQHYQKKIKKIKIIKGEKKEIITIKDNLSDTSKILYSLLCNQLSRSLENGWWDEFKRVYVKFSLEKLALILNKSRDTIITCKKELEENGLLEIKDTGLGKADIFYIGKVKDRPIEDIEFEILDLTFNQPVETFDSIKLLYKTNNKTTTTRSSENSFCFLTKDRYPLLNIPTINNIKKLIPDISEDDFNKLYSLTENEIKAGKGKEFNAILYKALKQEWVFIAEEEKRTVKANEENKIKAKFNHYSVMVKTCDNFNFAFQEFKNSISVYENSLTSKYIEKFKQLE